MDNDKDELPVLNLSEALTFVKESVDDFRMKLKRYRFDFDSVDEKGKTFLINLVETMPITDYLWVVLEYFADVNIKDTEKARTALHYACKASNKGMILALLFFGAQTDIVDKDGKKPFDLCLILKEDLENLIDSINRIKTNFIQLTRKRRKMIKIIFDQIDMGTKVIDESKLATFNQILNDEPEEQALEDARLFLNNAKLFKQELDTKPQIVYEEFLVAIVKIVLKHGIKEIDKLIEKYKSKFEQTKNNNIDLG